ncbi:hypothetical protein JD969_14925 [Planctomycetota bacterium]|nr:hypothetical protein JD969_14925 [Planctomycetota bacterium]
MPQFTVETNDPQDKQYDYLSHNITATTTAAARDIFNKAGYTVYSVTPKGKRPSSVKNAPPKNYDDSLVDKFGNAIILLAIFAAIAVVIGHLIVFFQSRYNGEIVFVLFSSFITLFCICLITLTLGWALKLFTRLIQIQESIASQKQTK